MTPKRLGQNDSVLGMILVGNLEPAHLVTRTMIFEMHQLP